MHAAVHAGHLVDAPPGEHDGAGIGEILGAAVAMQHADALVPFPEPLEEIERRLARRALDRPRMELCDQHRMKPVERARKAAQCARLHAFHIDLHDIEPVEIGQCLVEHERRHTHGGAALARRRSPAAAGVAAFDVLASVRSSTVPSRSDAAARMTRT